MNKKILIIGIIFFLIVFGLSGCFEEKSDKKEDEKSSIKNTLIGSWETLPYYYENGTRVNHTASIATIYENNTMASKSIYDDSTIWNSYSMINDQFCLGSEPNVYCYDIEFFDNGNRVILLTYDEDPEIGNTNQLFVELIRTL